MVQFESLKNMGGGEIVQELAAAKGKEIIRGKTISNTVKSFDIDIVLAKLLIIAVYRFVHRSDETHKKRPGEA
jgi:hypothetical protein